jgi:aminobenzoyl-glutamate utilization protein B
MNLDEFILDYLEKNKGIFENIAKDIWGHPQIALQETYASSLQKEQLRKEGFSIEDNIKDMPTAFIASWGKGKPIIGILGEYDALPTLSQEVVAEKKPVQEGAPGHGCGHNLLGTAGLGAALALKEAMAKDGIKGTIRYYGCPAEETLVGKVFMAREGVFDDLDAAITWHPMYANTPWKNSSLALNSVKLNFHGISAHAAASPEAGRSALDGAILTDVGVNYLREHIPQEARMHSVITNGGLAPNVVPSEAQIWYYVRSPLRYQVKEIYARVLDIAKGAALMTGTSFDVDFLAGCYEYLPSKVLAEVMLEKLKIVGAPKFNEEERTFAAKLEATLPSGAVENALKSYGLTREEIGDPLSEKVLDRIPKQDYGTVMAGSTDVGDVSYITPTGQLTTCCMPLGIPVHSWQSTASVGSSIGMKGMMVAAKTLALTAIDLLTKPDILQAAHEEFEKETVGKRYQSPLPEGVKPH